MDPQQNFQAAIWRPSWKVLRKLHSTCGQVTLSQINPSASYAKSWEGPGPSLGHEGLPPSPSTVYEEAREAPESSVEYELQRTAQVAKDQHRTNTLRATSPLGDISLLDEPYSPWAATYALLSYPCVGHYSSPSPSAVFFCWAKTPDSSNPPSSPSWPSCGVHFLCNRPM